MGAIGGAFTLGNIFEHRANADKKIERAKNTNNAVKRTQAEAEKARAETSKTI